MNEPIRTLPDEDIALIAKKLSSWQKSVFFDPCCSYGKDVVRLAEHFKYIETVGLDAMRGFSTPKKASLTLAIPDGSGHVKIQPETFGLAFLNLPGNKAGKLSEYLKRVSVVLHDEGVLVLVATRDELFKANSKTKSSAADLIPTLFHNSKLYKTSEKPFRFVVFAHNKPGTDAKDVLQEAARYPLGMTSSRANHVVPAVGPLCVERMEIREPTPAEVNAALKNYTADYERVERLLPEASEAKRPLMPLRRGHVAQLLASGLMDGVVIHPETKERLLIKGSSTRIESKNLTDEGDEKTISHEVVAIQTMNSKGAIENIA